jgi:hypothetical protein
MDDMRREEVKRAVVFVRIHLDKPGRPRQMSVARSDFFTRYDNGLFFQAPMQRR